jgi:hypothetical protein
MSLELSLEIVLVIKNDSLVGDGDEDFLSGLVGQVMNTVVDVIVQSQGPFELECRGLSEVLLLWIVVVLIH